MVQAWLMDDSDADQRLSHKANGQSFVQLDELKKLGVSYRYFDPSNYENDENYRKLREEGGYNFQDIIEVSPTTLTDYESKIKSFYDEHIHTDEEVRYILEGTGYFDVRDFSDKWIRIAVSKGDMITLPSGIYHRFTIDENNYIKAVRLFSGEPVWTPLSRSDLQNDHPSLLEYREQFRANNINS